MINRNLIFAMALLSSLLSAGLHAAPNMSVQMVAEKEIIVTDEQGAETVQRVVAEDALPGDEIFYTLTYRNDGTSDARDIRLDNPVPAGTRYVPDSAWGDGTEISLDTNTETGQLTAVRWQVSEIPAGRSGSVGFSVMVE
ncbi:DUF11 domain-containing protein [Alcanivorax sp. JB21]|uniref:DUF11 domain-containing protein n=1 Tax=Alcanivorax limicola TaxID=2874102 RepID=UPI001CC13D79|nr:DUF11 domain-containing protein [Alcanivorax limicola]MBZ2188979.1 DUF11 domain-containing protein [Alcanivorax limicola]